MLTPPCRYDGIRAKARSQKLGTKERGIAGDAEPREITFISKATRTRIIRTPCFVELNSFPLIKISNEIYPEKSSLPSPFQRLPPTCHAGYIWSTEVLITLYFSFFRSSHVPLIYAAERRIYRRPDLQKHTK